VDGLDADVIVVGAGIAGAATAYYAAVRGLGVALLDAGLPGTEATGRNAGTLLLQSDHTESVPYVIRAYSMWDRLSAELEYDLEVRRHGGLRVAESEQDAGRLESLISTYVGFGADVRMVRGAGLGQLAGYLDRRVVAASFCPDEGSANPRSVGWAFARAAQRRGAVVAWQNKVLRVDCVAGGYQVQTQGATWRAPRVLLAAGPWTAALAAQLGVSLPTYVRHLQVHVTERVAPVYPQIVTRVGGGLTFKQVAAGNVLIGGGWPAQPQEPGTGRGVSVATMAGNLAVATRLVPSVSRLRIIRTWTGFENTSPDYYPVFGEVGRQPGLFVLTGARGGFVAGPLLGLLMAQVLSGEEPDMDVSKFALERFQAQPEEAAT
jgi:sarcosine oxidase, subunit beta